MIILNSARAAVDMLDKKSAIYSDRPTLQMGGELVGWKNTLVLLPYGDRFRRYRRIFYSLIGSQATMKQYHPPQELETRRFLRRVLSKPEELAAHVRKYVTMFFSPNSVFNVFSELPEPSSCASLTDMKSKRTMIHSFDLQIKPLSNFRLPRKPEPSSWTWFLLVRPFVQYFIRISELIGGASPAVRYVPDWFPGAGFKQRAKAWAATLQEMVEQPHNFVKQQVVGVLLLFRPSLFSNFSV